MNNIESLYHYCQNKGIVNKKNEQLKNYTSFKIGGPCSLMIFPKFEAELIDIIKIIKENNIPFYLLGNGSNVLISENQFDGVFIITSQLNNFNVSGEHINSECGLSLTKLSIAAKQKALHGLEFAYGIPGTVGGAVYMNAGAYGGEMGRITESSRYIDLYDMTIKSIDNKEHDFSYRESIYNKKDYIMLSVVLKLVRGEKNKIEAEMNKNINARKEKQPLEYPSAGSTFKRGKDFYTAQIIDECGLKGFQIGGAAVSIKHAGFVINKDNATFEDVLDLIAYIKDTVYAKTGKQIENEVKVINF